MLFHKYIHTQTYTCTNTNTCGHPQAPADTLHKLPRRSRAPLPATGTAALPAPSLLLVPPSQRSLRLGMKQGPFLRTLACATQGEEVAPSLIIIGQGSEWLWGATLKDSRGWRPSPILKDCPSWKRPAQGRNQASRGATPPSPGVVREGCPEVVTSALRFESVRERLGAWEQHSRGWAEVFGWKN